MDLAIMCLHNLLQTEVGKLVQALHVFHRLEYVGLVGGSAKYHNTYVLVRKTNGMI